MNKTLTYIDNEIIMLYSYIEQCKELRIRYKELFEKSGDPLDAHPVEAYKESIEYAEKKIKRLQECKNEIIKQTKIHTLEEIKQIWENAKYEWEGTDPQNIYLYKEEKTIKINIIYLEYECYDYLSTLPVKITSEEHNLITKTLKALEVENAKNKKD